MVRHAHAVVWMDQRAAQIFEFNRDDTDKHIVRRGGPPQRIHHRTGALGTGHRAEDRKYLEAVAHALNASREFLIVGPGDVKTTFKAYLDRNLPEVAAKVVGLETLFRPETPDIMALARRFFQRTDHVESRDAPDNS
jgi:stalled ribosome rescue protein Dom34